MSKEQASQTKTASEAKKDETHSGSAPQDIQAQLDELKRGFSRLGNREQALIEREAALDSVLKEHKELKTKVERAELIEKMLIDNPYEAYKIAGGNPTQIHSKVASGVAEDDPAQVKLKSLEQTISKLTNTVEQLTQKELKEQQAKAQQTFISQVEQITKSYPMVSDLDGSVEIVKQVLQSAKSEGKELSVEDAVKQVNEEVKSRVAKLASHLPPDQRPTEPKDEKPSGPLSIKNAKERAMAQARSLAEKRKADKKG
jgi:hypothetical protein